MPRADIQMIRATAPTTTPKQPEVAPSSSPLTKEPVIRMQAPTKTIAADIALMLFESMETWEVFS